MPEKTQMINTITVTMWTKRFKILLLAMLPAGTGLSAQPGSPQTGRILILGATAHLGTGAVIEKSAIGFTDGRIDFAGTASRVNASDYDRVINAEGKHVYPGFIAANTTLGLGEISAVRATNDYREVGEYNPNVRSIIAYNAESLIIPTTVANGVLLAQITPRGGVFSGTSSVVQLDAWNWEDAIVRKDDGVHLNWPETTTKTGWYASFGKLETSKPAYETIAELETFFKDARAYCKQIDKKTTNLRLQAMCGVLNGKQTLYIHTDRVRDIASAIQFAKAQGVARIVIVGGSEAWMIPEVFIDNEIPVMLSRIHALPELPGDDIEQPYKAAAQLHEAGVSFCLQNDGAFDRIQLRNIPFNAGTAVAHGLPYEKAVQTLTLDVAEVLGIDDRYGSLAVGKSATLFISEGDALDMRSNDVSTVFIDGREVRLENHQEQLYRLYRGKYSE